MPMWVSTMAWRLLKLTFSTLAMGRNDHVVKHLPRGVWRFHRLGAGHVLRNKRDVWAMTYWRLEFCILGAALCAALLSHFIGV
jgi:hypothetical protein